MTQKTVKLLIPFESLVDSISKLSLTEKRLLWELLAEQIAQAEAETSTAQTELREAQADYQIETVPPLDEHTVELKHQVVSLLDTLSEAKLAVIFDFVQFLAEQGQEVDWMNAQSQSAAYQEWVGSDNDIYDEVFADVHPAG